MAQTGNTVSSTIDAQPALGRDFRSLLGELVTLNHITGAGSSSPPTGS